MSREILPAGPATSGTVPQYVELYGEENAEYLMEHQNHWLHNYQNCGYITCPLGDLPEHIEFAKQVSRDFGWTYQEIPGDLAYLSRLINGPLGG